MTERSVVADVGSGTGLLAKLFCDNGNWVHGIEPNQEMRAIGERLLTPYPRFTSVVGTAEATTLDDGSVDLVTVGQAFHWFDQPRKRREFARILKPSGWVVLVWNERRLKSTAFLAAYEQLLLRYGTDYEQVRHERVTSAIGSFFAPCGFNLRIFPNKQTFDFEGLQGRLLSSSYVPQEGHPTYLAMMDELRAIFLRHQVSGQVIFEYDTKVYYGQFM